MRRVWGALLAGCALGGCGGADDEPRARAVVQRFYDAVRHDRAWVACDQLSRAARRQLESQSGQTCPDVITRLEYEGGAVVDVHVHITSAKVDLRGGESAFLSLEAGRWRLSAIGCRPEDGPPRDVPFSCEVEA